MKLTQLHTATIEEAIDWGKLKRGLAGAALTGATMLGNVSSAAGPQTKPDSKPAIAASQPTSLDDIRAMANEIMKLHGQERIKAANDLLETLSGLVDKAIEGKKWEDAQKLAKEGLQLAGSSPAARDFKDALEDIAEQVKLTRDTDQLYHDAGTDETHNKLILHLLTKVGDAHEASQHITDKTDLKLVEIVNLVNKKDLTEEEIGKLAIWYSQQNTLMALQKSRSYYREIAKSHEKDKVGLQTKVKIQEVQDKIDKIAPPKTFKIQANLPWQPTVHVKAGQEYFITAEGTWGIKSGKAYEATPDGCIDPRIANLGYLKGKIANNPEFKIGSSHSITASGTGILYMQMQDTELEDNLGALLIHTHR